ncbi:transposase [Novosphingobium aquae]|uniref:Transposase n=1 Tax=Novosphingobium aquae TaxID=3133435 RepID=A0ABU8SG07_9SPHN
MGQNTLFSGPERRRRWTEEERVQILTEAFSPGACVADVAWCHDVSTALTYTWRSKVRQSVVESDFAEAAVVAGDGGEPSIIPFTTWEHTTSSSAMRSRTAIAWDKVLARRSLCRCDSAPHGVHGER